MRTQKARGRQRGVSAIEFGIILPVFCALLFGLVDYGYWFFVDLAATNAVREGARTATTFAGACPNATATSQGQSAITTYLNNIGLGALAASPVCSCTTTLTGPQFQCSLTINFQRITGYPWVPMPAAGGGFGSSYTSVSTNATMRGSN
jgi:Flp pilus assembly protein TadG